MLYVMEIDMDREENQYPQQHLDATEDIKSTIIPLSQLSYVVQGW